jgi:hypothetical protein
MAKKTLRIDLDVGFSLLGVSCHLKDYRFAWTLNHALGTNFKKEDPFIIEESEQEFSRYIHHTDSEEMIMFSNKSTNGYLVRKKKEVDYWIKFHEDIDQETTKFTLETLRQNNLVLAVFEEHDRITKEQFVY